MRRVLFGESFGPLHPKSIFFLELGQIGNRFAGQVDHQTEKGRLTTAEIIRPVSIGDVAIRIDQVGEVVHHILDQVRFPGDLQAQHGEIGVPVIDFTKAAARHNIAVGQG